MAKAYSLTTRYNVRYYRPYIIAIGRLVIAWNELHERLAFLFSAILSDEQRRSIPKKDRATFYRRELERIAGIWSSSAYDRPKRAMLEGLMTPLVTDDFIRFPNFVSDIKWVLEETNKLEEFRNNAVHVPITIGIGATAKTIEEHISTFGVVPDIFMKNRRALKLAHKSHQDVLREHRWTCSAAIVLSDFTLKICWALLFDEAPWPRRPSLPNRGQRKSRRDQHPQRRPK
jgi:hypothetical protein